MRTVLSQINELLTELSINYEFGQMSTIPPVYPYWVGDYTTAPAATEDGRSEGTIILVGFARNNFLQLENDREVIEETFKHDLHCYVDGKCIVFSYGGSYNIPTDDNDLKRCDITINFKKWSA